MKPITLNLIFTVVISCTYFVFTPELMSQTWTTLPKKTANFDESILFQYDDDNSGTHSLGIGLDFTNTTERPSARFHIWAGPLNLTPLKLENFRLGFGNIMESLGIIEIGSKKTIGDDEYYFGIYQNGITTNWYNYLKNRTAIGFLSPSGLNANSLLSVNGQIDLKECLYFSDSDNHRYEITIEYEDPNEDQFVISFSKKPDVFQPLILDPTTVSVQGTLITNFFQLINGAGLNKVLVSDIDGNGTWTDASLFHDDDWLISYPHGDGNLKNLYLNPDYQKVGLGTTDPMQLLHICGGNILISRPLGEAPGSLNGSLYFGAEVTPEYPNGEWGIEYYTEDLNYIEGLNFWKVNTNSGTSGDFRLFLHNDGNVGIGTSNPRSLLEVKGEISSEDVYVAGRIGIGTTTPQSELAVNGIITAKEVKVTVEGFPDYVFNPEYKLRSLNELEEYIKFNKHLPDIPTEKDVRKTGLDLGQMNANLLKKVEELTLYIIELDKEVKELKSELEKNN